MIWNASGNDTLNIYLPGTDLSQPLTPDYTFNTVDFDQAQFDLLTVSTLSGGTAGSTDASPIDEIRLGSSYASVVPVPETSPSVAAGLLGVCALFRRRRA